MSISFWAE